MPNWCNNSITITGDVETLSQLKPVIAAGEGLLQAIKPMPKELRETVKGSGDELQTEVYDGATNWYDWAVTNWGTKWDPEVHLEFEDNGDGTATINGWFDTAWAPPIDAFQTLVDDWDSCYIELMYEESGMCFVGCFDSEGGDDYYEYSEATSKTIKDIVPAYLVEAFALDERLAEYEEEEEQPEELAN
jgi:hypothetical protein